ncbi:FecR family protein [Methylovulum miyakonense]|uniref:FecR family protein n=1 Tax=Methylovulum miyakonense TaxID=645578 RepID=UPI00037D528A|nr:FecR family protein [Methylovulum miyakonense]
MSYPLEPDTSSPHSHAQDQALAWFARLQDSKVSDNDKAAFAQWLATSPAHQAAFNRVEQLWQSPALTQALSQYAAITFPVTRQRNQPLRWATAASVVLVCGWLFAASGLITRWQADYVTATGEQRRIELADGSAIILNTDSAVSLNFSDTQRGIKFLQGEAYFEVQPDKTKPFIVATEQGTVRVVGTRFTVKAGAITEVDVDSGIVACAGEISGNVQLTAGQHTEISPNNVSPATIINSTRSFAWLKGRLIFQDQTLAQVIAELDRYHPGAILISDTKLRQTRITGNYKLGDTAAVIRTLADIIGAKVITFSPYLTVLKS